jgi:hypothetical protein
MVRYTVKPDQAEANEALVREVYDELDRTRPDGLRYATFRLDDGVSFVHVASVERTATTRCRGCRRFSGSRRRSASAATSVR